MTKWFRFILKGHLMIMTLNARLKASNEAHSKFEKLLDARVEHCAAIEERAVALEAECKELRDALKAAASRDKSPAILKSRSMADFRKNMGEEINNVS